jgi:hypothetical protein
MPRALTPRAILEAQRLNSSDSFLVLLSFLIPGPDPDIRVVNNSVNIVSRGSTYIGMPFRIILPDEAEYATTNARLELDNVDPTIWQGIRLLTAAPEVIIEVILASDPDVILIRSVGLKLREASATNEVISGLLIPDSVWQAGYPEADFDPPQNRGLFT